MNYQPYISMLSHLHSLINGRYEKEFSKSLSDIGLITLISCCYHAFDKCHDELIEAKELATKLQKENELLQGILNGINSREVKKL